MANTPNQPLSARCARAAGIVRGDATFRNGCPRLARILFDHDDAYFYLLLVTLVPDAFNQSIVLTDSFGASRLLYFSFATLTTTGYGDIAPVHPWRGAWLTKRQ
jgi:hypothetical protein